MKNISFVLIGFMLSLSVKGQSIFERFADYDDVSLVSISPKMFKMLGQLSVSLDDPEAQEYIDMVSSIENFKVLISGNDEVSDAMSKWAAEQLSSKDLEELMTIKDSDADVIVNVDFKEVNCDYIDFYLSETKKIRVESGKGNCALSFLNDFNKSLNL